jgi:hypothetical protein
MQQGQVFELKKRAVDGSPVWAYRYRTDGPGSWAVDARWTSKLRQVTTGASRNGLISRNFAEPSDGLEPSTPSLPMEDSRCGRETEEQRLFAGFPCY